MEKSELQTTGSSMTLYGKFAGCFSAVKAHKFFMKPSGEEIDHWTASLYGLSDHIYHLFHASTDILIQIGLFGLFLRMSWNIVTSELKQSGGSQPSEFSNTSDS